MTVGVKPISEASAVRLTIAPAAFLGVFALLADEVTRRPGNLFHLLDDLATSWRSALDVELADEERERYGNEAEEALEQILGYLGEEMAVEVSAYDEADGIAARLRACAAKVRGEA